MLFLIIFFLSLAASFIFTWWAAAIIAFIAALYGGKTVAQSFWSGFLALALVWLLLALLKSIPNNNILASRIAQMMHLPGWISLLLITVILGGLVGGMSSMSGLFVKHAFKHDKKLNN